MDTPHPQPLSHARGARGEIKSRTIINEMEC